jgi:hypothetical protein
VFYGEKGGGDFITACSKILTTWLIALIKALNFSARSFLVGFSNIKPTLAPPPQKKIVPAIIPKGLI